MTSKEFYKHLTTVNSSRESRRETATMVLNDMQLIQILIDVFFMVDDKVSCKAAWVLEYVAKKDIRVFLPYIEKFTFKINSLRFGSSIRPAAKICEILISAYYGKKIPQIKQALQKTHLEKITETCFDWLIGKQKVAVKAHSMLTLYYLGQDYDWIHPELKLILERDFNSSSAGFKARARHILKKIKK